MLPGAIDEAFLKLQSKRLRQHITTMSSREEDGVNAAPDTFYESFRWMEENDGLDLRLGFDNFDTSFQEQAPLSKQNQIGRRPSFRRHLSMTKKPFSRSSSVVGHSRPGTKDTATAPSLRSTPSPAPGNQGGHVRRKSRALSLISLNKQSARESAAAIDPAAAHYRDPSARMTLREYMTTPQKFDEALEYGFPSLGEVDETDHSGMNGEQRTFLDDGKSSTHSTVSDFDSPKTPPILEKPMPVQSPRVCTDPVVSSHLGCASASTNPREMTLRMTLTRPDLRAHEDNIYGWQKSAAVRKAHMRGESLAPVTPDMEANLKESMEKHFAALDQENLDTHDDGVVRRFWKRVRRN